MVRNFFSIAYCEFSYNENVYQTFSLFRLGLRIGVASYIVHWPAHVLPRLSNNFFHLTSEPNSG